MQILAKLLVTGLLLLGLTGCEAAPETPRAPALIRPRRSGDAVLIGLADDVMRGRVVNETISATNHAYPWGDLLMRGAIVPDDDQRPGGRVGGGQRAGSRLEMHAGQLLSESHTILAGKHSFLSVYARFDRNPQL